MRRVESEEDWKIVLETLIRVSRDVKDNPTKAMHQHVCPITAYRFLRDGGASVCMVGGYMVVFGITKPWYSQITILTELLIVRVGKGGTLRGVVQFLKTVAEECGAEILTVGTAFAPGDENLSRLYQAAGMTPEAVTLTMEV